MKTVAISPCIKKSHKIQTCKDNINTNERSKEIEAELSLPDGIAKRFLGDSIVDESGERSKTDAAIADIPCGIDIQKEDITKDPELTGERWQRTRTSDAGA